MVVDASASVLIGVGKNVSCWRSFMLSKLWAKRGRAASNLWKFRQIAALYCCAIADIAYSHNSAGSGGTAAATNVSTSLLYRPLASLLRRAPYYHHQKPWKERFGSWGARLELSWRTSTRIPHSCWDQCVCHVTSLPTWNARSGWGGNEAAGSCKSGRWGEQRNREKLTGYMKTELKGYKARE